jgi:hypothetical protein
MTTATSGKPQLIWDQEDIYRRQVEYLVQEMGLSESEAGLNVLNDHDLYTIAWDDLCDYLSELMSALNPSGHWQARVVNFGWRRLNGEKFFQAMTGRELLQAILPQTDCSFKIYIDDVQIRINNAHHDSPTWDEWYYIRPRTYSFFAIYERVDRRHNWKLTTVRDEDSWNLERAKATALADVRFRRSEGQRTYQAKVVTFEGLTDDTKIPDLLPRDHAHGVLYNDV